MKLAISKTALSRALTAAGKAVESRTTIPILTNVMLVAGANQLTITGTDLDIVATASTPCDVTTPGEICVDAKLLAGIASKAGDDISLVLEDDKLIVKSGRSRFSLQTLPTNDFPSMNEGSYSATFDLDIAALFAPVAFAISTEETRYYLNGVFFHGVDGKTIAVATDGHRLGRHIAAATEDFPGIIVPRKTVGLFPKGMVAVSVSENKIRIEATDFTLVSKLIDGTFPDYQRVIPTANDKLVVVDRDAFMKASDRVATISSERGRAVKFSIASGGIRLLVNNPDSGEAEDEVVADYTGEPFDIGFNAQYVRDVFSILPSGPVEMALADGGAPALIKGAAEGLSLVLMPMRV